MTSNNIEQKEQRPAIERSRIRRLRLDTGLIGRVEGENLLLDIDEVRRVMSGVVLCPGLSI